MNRIITTLRTFLQSKFVQDTITLQFGKMSLVAISAGTFVVVLRGLGPAEYGVFQLVLTMYGLLMTFNLTGIGLSTITRLAEAVGAGNRVYIRNLMAFYVQVSALVALVALAIMLLAGPAFAAFSYGSPYVGQLAIIYTAAFFLNGVYNLALITLQSTRAMRSYAALENVGTVAESVLKLIAVTLFVAGIGHEVEVFAGAQRGMPLLEAGLMASAVTVGRAAFWLVLALTLSMVVRAVVGVFIYRREQRRRPALLPHISEIGAAAITNSPRPYWRFGLLLAVDKKLAELFILLPQQMLGMWSGPEAVGFLRTALNSLQYLILLFRGILTNLETRLPADVGQADYIRLEDNFRRVLRLVVPISVGLFGLFALFAPVVVPVLGAEYIPVIPVIRVLCLYGMISGIGGIFGPLYRTLRVLPAMVGVKIVALLAGAVAGVLLRSQGAFGGAWMINLVFAISVGLTIGITLPRVRRLAREQAASS